MFLYVAVPTTCAGAYCQPFCVYTPLLENEEKTFKMEVFFHVMLTLLLFSNILVQRNSLGIVLVE